MNDTYHTFGIPDSITGTIVTLCIALTLAPYAAGMDFGVIKVPTFSPAARRRLKFAGPLLLILAIGGFVPTWHTGPSPVEVKNRIRATINLGEPFSFGEGGISVKYYDNRGGPKFVLVQPDGQEIRGLAIQGSRYDFVDGSRKFTFLITHVSGLFLQVTLEER